MTWQQMMNKVSDEPILWAVLILIFLVFGVLIVSGLAIAFMWIKWSLIKRENSANMTGADLTRKVLDKGGLGDVKIKNSFLYIKYWNYNKRRRSYRLRPWTHNRKSVWTMMEAAQQSWVSTLRSTNKKQYWLIFRIPFLIKFGGSILSIISGILAYYIIHKAGSWSLLSKDAKSLALFWTDVSLGLSIGVVAFMIAEVGKIYLIRKNVVPYIEGMGLSKAELGTIKRIYNWRMVYAIADAVIEIIRLIAKIASKVNEKNG